MQSVNFGSNIIKKFLDKKSFNGNDKILYDVSNDIEVFCINRIIYFKYQHTILVYYTL